jgi:outer membrane protein assembly factor BamB
MRTQEATASNLVFSGDGKGMMYALNASTGAKLWSQQPFPNVAMPVTYKRDGKPYISVLSGNGAASSAPTRLYTFEIDGKTAMPVKP